jgi:hypothetical protein
MKKFFQLKILYPRKLISLLKPLRSVIPKLLQSIILNKLKSVILKL